jgi:superfamily I DNA/RNA helicase
MRSIAGGSEAGILHTSKFEIPGGIDVDAILARNNATLDELELRFKDQGKPFVRLRTRPEPSANVKLSRAYLRVLENPYDKPATVTCLRAMYGNDGAAYKHALENDVKGLPSSDGIVLHAEKLGEDGQAEIATYHELMRQGWTPAEYWSALAMGELEAPTPTTIPDGAVVLSTIHLAKGREWPRVALILEGLHNNEADRNVKYVGVTRAKDALYIVE